MEMEDLSPSARKTRSPATARSDAEVTSEREGSVSAAVADNTVVTWAYVKATWFVLLSLPLLAMPRFLLFMSAASGGEHRDNLTPLEDFLSTHFGILLLSLAVGIVVSIPPDAPVESRHKRPSPHPLVLPITCGSLLTAFISYNTPASRVGSLAFLVALGAGSTGIWGVWVLLFAGSSSISTKTGADRRTSRFIFGNRSAASAQKKQWKQEHEPPT